MPSAEQIVFRPQLPSYLDFLDRRLPSIVKKHLEFEWESMPPRAAIPVKAPERGCRHLVVDPSGAMMHVTRSDFEIPTEPGTAAHQLFKVTVGMRDFANIEMQLKEATRDALFDPEKFRVQTKVRVRLQEQKVSGEAAAWEECFERFDTLKTHVHLTFNISEAVSWSYGDTLLANETKTSTVQTGFYIPQMIEDRGTYVVNGNERTPVGQIVPKKGLFAEAYGDANSEGSDADSRRVVLRIRPDRGPLHGTKRNRTSLHHKLSRHKLDGGSTLRVEVRAGKSGVLQTKVHFGKRRINDRQLRTLLQDRNGGCFSLIYPPCASAHHAGADSHSEMDDAPQDIDCKGASEDFLDLIAKCELAPSTRERVNKKLGPCFESLRIAQPSATHLLPEDLAASIAYAVRLWKKQFGGIDDPLIEADDLNHLKNYDVLLAGDHLEQLLDSAMRLAVEQIKESIQATVEKNRASDLLQTLASELQRLPAMLNRRVERYMTGRGAYSSLCMLLDRTNPLAEISHKRQVTFFGKGGLPNDYKSETRRELHPSHFGRLCSCETPESSRIGLALHLAAFAQVADKTIKTPVRPIGKDEVHYVGPDDSNQVSLSGGALLKRDNDRISSLGDQAASHSDVSDGQQLGLAASLIPFIQHTDFARALMAAKNMKQAVPLTEPEVPIVLTGFEKIIAEGSNYIRSAAADGKVIGIEEMRGIGGRRRVLKIQQNDSVEEILLQGPQPTPEWTYSEVSPAHNSGDPGTRRPLQPGDTIRQGLPLTSSPCCKDGYLALGTNLVVGYFPWHGYNFNDGIVASEKAAEKLASVHVREFCYPLHPWEHAGRPATLPDHIKTLPGLLNVSANGLVQEGTDVTPGNVLALVYSRFSEEAAERSKDNRKVRIGETDCNFAPRPIRVESGEAGRVIRSKIVRDPEGRRFIQIWIRTERRLQVGDKLMGRHGNKGVVCKILPTREMPYIELEGRRREIDLIMNPHSVLSRMNLGQLIETHYGLVALAAEMRNWSAAGAIRGTGSTSALRFEFPPFEQVPFDDLAKTLQSVSCPGGKTSVYYIDEQGVSQALQNPVTIGYQYILKLNHLADVKVHARGRGPRYLLATDQPSKGKRFDGGQRVGEMESWALMAHRAWNIHRELFSELSDDRAGRFEVPIETLLEHEPDTIFPESFRSLFTLLAGRAIKTTFVLRNGEEKDPVRAAPGELVLTDIKEIKLKIATQEDIKSWGKELQSADFMEYGEWIRLSCGCEGLASEVTERLNPIICKRHGRIARLKCCEPNPEGQFLEITTKQENGSFACRKCSARIRLKTRPNVIWAQDLRIKYREAQKPVYKSDGIFSPEIFGRIDATDFHSTHKTRTSMGWIRVSDKDIVPVLPISYRPPQPPDGRSLSRINWLYCQLLKLKSKREPVELVKEIREEIDKFIDSLIKGKFGVVRRFLLGKRVDYSARAVISADPDIKMNEVRIPEIAARRLFAPLFKRIGAEMAEHRFFEDLTSLKTRAASHQWGAQRVKKEIEVLISRNKDAERIISVSYDDTLQPGILKKREGPAIEDQSSQREGAAAARNVRLSYDRKKHDLTWNTPEPLAFQFVPDGLPANVTNDLEILKKVIEDRSIRVLLNRQPSLHRYSLLSFKPVIGSEPAIGLHPLVCKGFNADFDGDQMAIYMCWKSQKEMERLAAERHLFSVANGSLQPGFQQDMAAGRYLQDLISNNFKAEEYDPKKYDEEIRQLIRANNADVVQKVQIEMNEAFKASSRFGLSLSIFDFDDLWKACRATASSYHSVPGATNPDPVGIAPILKNDAENTIQNKLPESPSHPVSVLVLSGARGDKVTVAQIVALRGPVELGRDSFYQEPVRSCFRGGLHPYEFFVTGIGGRNTLVDKKLGPALFGYWTRKLIHSAMDLTIVERDCGTEDGVSYHFNTDQLAQFLQSRFCPLVGRKLSADGKLVVDPKDIKEEMLVRSPLTCKSNRGICQACYGHDLSTGDWPAIGLPVGVIAAESIGERGTQETMRTFHGRGGEALAGIPGVLKFLDGEGMKRAAELEKQGNSLKHPQQAWDLLLPLIVDSKFFGSVDLRHFEVILRSILVLPTQDDQPVQVRSIHRGAAGGRTFLDRCSFARANHVLLDAARNRETAAMKDVGLRARIMMGGLVEQGEG